MSDGKKHGTFKKFSYFFNDLGKNILIRKGNYVNDKKNGKWKTYSRNTGYKIVMRTFKMGILHGIKKIWSHTGSENHSITRIGSYSDGKKAGVWTKYFLNGTISKKGSYGITGTKEGYWKVSSATKYFCIKEILPKD